MNKAKIIYVTTALKEEDFSSSLEQGRKINPAGQNFHSRLINALSEESDLAVISIPPTWLEQMEKEGSYSYKKAPSKKWDRYFKFPKEIAESLKIDATPVVVYDSTNVLVAKVANAIATKNGLKKVAILTDNPKNISNVSALYPAAVKSASSKADGYISLTNGLISIFKGQRKPHIVLEGIAEEITAEPVVREKPYFYFGGALYEKYGVKSMIEAFTKSKANYELLIAGHGPLESEILSCSKLDPRIVYLGQLDKKENIRYEKGASLLINPRPWSEELDKNSVPSKLFEYLVTEKPILSTRHSVLQDKYPTDVNWISGKNVEKEIYEFLKKHLNNDGKLIDVVPNSAKNAVLSTYGSKQTALKIISFIASI